MYFFIFFFFYILLSYISFKYTVRDILPEKVDYIVVLSGSSDSMTLRRIDVAKKLANNYLLAQLITCGKFKSDLFRNSLSEFKDRLVVQNMSTNTYEDAKFSKEIIGDSRVLILVTSHSHQIRSINTFEKFFNKNCLFSYPTNDIFTLYSPILPTGWIAALVNYLKDRRYNR